MSGSITDLVDRVTDSNGGRPVVSTLAAPGKTIGASSINLTDATNWSTTSAIHFSIYKTNAQGYKDVTTQTDWKGVLAGTTISNLTLTGGTDQAYNAGDIVEITPTARYAKDLFDAFEQDHDVQGHHKTVTDANGNEWIEQGSVVNAVNQVKLSNAAVGNAPSAGANGDDTDIDYEIYGKGKGSPRFRGFYDGWVKANETFTYSSWDATYKTGVITVADGTNKYSVGNRIKLTQATGGTKYFIVTAVGVSSITVYGGTDYTLNNQAITSPFFSREKAPQGFPLDPAKWSVRVTSSSSNTSGSPTSGTFVNVSALDLAIPIGVWNVSYQVTMLMSRTSGSGNASVESCLSTATTSASDNDLRQYTQVVAATSGTQVAQIVEHARRKALSIAAGTTYHFNWVAQDTGMATTGLYVAATNNVAIVEAVCAYL